MRFIILSVFVILALVAVYAVAVVGTDIITNIIYVLVVVEIL